ncbi:hypothetical protein FIBSPDRAFT_276064 [Athelia psychrophila]|uniref:BTB domain-containing protein n=1 Tax=Athelia psychrophila TaxID=1759441 RepID=A0A166REM5_9AGAM|nr:hypothetical protein FIBSPDRAFT_276064 [Fibularhizoctonia sp. CBS 109695]
MANTSTIATNVQNKRKRVGGDTPEPPVPVPSATRSDSIWLDDGNIVIQAQTTQYKVHRSILAAHSPIFRDMFSMPQPPSEGEVTVEGCPVVHVSDRAADVTIVLQALFLRGHVVAGEPLPIKVVAAFLRLGKKYEIELLHAEALKRLRYEFPSTLGGHNKCNRGAMISLGDDIAVAVANLAREQSLLSVLPLALYQCCNSSSHQGGEPQIAGIGPIQNDTTAVLSSVNVRACFAAWNSLSIAQARSTLAWMDSDKYPTCTSPERCAKIRRNTLRTVFFPFVSFSGLDTWRDFPWLDGEMCSSCNAVAEKLHNDGRVEFWDALPRIFGLPGWDELTTVREECA